MKGCGQYNCDLKKEKELVTALNCDSDQSSSIGVPSDDGGSDTEGEVQSGVALNSLASLEASLPIKKGISIHYAGKSKSFSNLAAKGLEDAKEIGKQEHLMNRKRRLIVSHKWRNRNRKRPSISHQAPGMPVFPLENGEDEDGKHGEKATSRIF